MKIDMQTDERCTRIWIHINLQFSFLLRAGIWLFHDIYARKSLDFKLFQIVSDWLEL